MSLSLIKALGVLAALAAFFGAMWYMNRLSRIRGQKEAQNEVLSKTAEVQDKQLEIAARPPVPLSDSVERMRNNGL